MVYETRDFDAKKFRVYSCVGLEECKIIGQFDTAEEAIIDCAERNYIEREAGGGYLDRGHYFTTDVEGREDHV